MPSRSIYHFQNNLYGILTAHTSLPKVYLSVQQDAKYPFILINLQKVINLSKYDLVTYEIDFEICIFARTKTQETLLNTMTIISELIKPKPLSNKCYKVLSIKDQNMNWIRGHDLLTTKLVVEYKGLIQQE